MDLPQTTPFDLSRSRWYARHKGKTLRIAFCILNNDKNLVSLAISSISAYVKKYNTNIDIRLFHIVQTVEDEKYKPKGFTAFLKNWEPDLLAMSVFSTQWDSIKPYLTEIKDQMPELAVVIGSYQAILKSDDTIAFPPVDFICDGDGEVPFSNLVKYMQGEIHTPVQGLWEKLADGSIHKTPKYNLEDLNSIPYPDYEIYDIKRHFYLTGMDSHREQKRLLPVITGRGCVYNCTYCSNSTLRKMWPNKKTFMRKFDPEAYSYELARLRDKYELQYFEFWDELFFSDVTYSLEFFEHYKKNVGLPFSVASRIEVMDYELCKKAADAGCDAIYFGLESGSEEYRKKYLKRFEKNQQILDAAENCRKVGIKRITFNIMGMPFETKEQMQETLAINQKIDPEYFYIFTYIPLKGTKLYEIAEENGLLYDSLRTAHYVEGMYTGKRVKMNIKSIGNSATEDEFNEVCRDMVEYQRSRAML